MSRKGKKASQAATKDGMSKKVDSVDGRSPAPLSKADA